MIKWILALILPVFIAVALIRDTYAPAQALADTPPHIQDEARKFQTLALNMRVGGQQFDELCLGRGFCASQFPPGVSSELCGAGRMAPREFVVLSPAARAFLGEARASELDVMVDEGYASLKRYCSR